MSSSPTTIKLSQTDIERLPNYRKQTANEWSAACPFCGTGDDRFRYWPNEGNYWCRVCESKGFISETNTLAFDREKWLYWQEQERQRKDEARQKELSTLRRLNQANRLEFYRSQLKDRFFWYNKGLLDETIDKYGLGYCPACPTYPDSPSYTIPITYSGKLYNIRHRLVNPGSSGKYRPEMAGLPAAMFNADSLSQPGLYIVIVEGEIKAMVLEQWGINAVAIPGANVFKSKWLKLFPKSKTVYIALDPGQGEQAQNIEQILGNTGIRAGICQFEVKPDDYLTIGENDREDFLRVMTETSGISLPKEKAHTGPPKRIWAEQYNALWPKLRATIA